MRGFARIYTTALLAALISLMPSSLSWAGGIAERRFELAFNDFTAKYRPDLPLEARDLLRLALWDASGADVFKAATLAVMCPLECSLKVRRYYPEVLPRLDYLGSHNNVTFLELRLEGLITDSKKWQTSQQWKAWRKQFEARPDLGTMYAGRYFTRLCKKQKVDFVAQAWKCKPGTIPALERLMQVRCMRKEFLLLVYRRR